MKNQKGFIQIPLLIAIIAGILVLGGGYFGLKQYQGYQKEKIEKKRIAQEKEAAAQETQRQKDLEVEKLKEELEKIRKQEQQTTDRDLEIEKLKKEIEKVKNQKPQAITNTIVAPDKSNSSIDLPLLVSKWRPFVARIVCDFQYANGGSYQKSGGSGIISNDRSGKAFLITNKHIVQDSNGYGAYSCSIMFLEDKNIFTVNGDSIQTTQNAGHDIALINIKNPDNYVSSLASKGFTICGQDNSFKASLGDSIIILGYPSIGSPTDITVTEGIISGYDGDYYVTSAKVEHGNSGGAAVMVKGDCYLGIPTFAKTGDVESLSRVLDINKIK